VPARQAIRNIIIFIILVKGLAWLGPVLGGDPSAPGLGFLVWAIAPLRLPSWSSSFCGTTYHWASDQRSRGMAAGMP
jgi:hypothetical protein